MFSKNILAQLAALSVVTSSSLGLATVSTPAMASIFPGSSTFIKPCFGTLNCVTFRERLHILQGLGKSKPALNYCREKYGNEATVEWRFGFRWCATPFQI